MSTNMRCAPSCARAQHANVRGVCSTLACPTCPTYLSSKNIWSRYPLHRTETLRARPRRWIDPLVAALTRTAVSR